VHPCKTHKHPLGVESITFQVFHDDDGSYNDNDDDDTSDDDELPPLP
jgi:hypothetical protein